MKTPDEIKKGLEQCSNTGVSCSGCPYDNDCHDPASNVSVETDALAYIQQLEGEVAHYTSPKYRRPAEIELSNIVTKKKAKIIELESRLAQVERERDAAVADLAVIKFCALCKEDANTQEYGSDKCHACFNKSEWQWRGVCEENTKGGAE